MSKLADLFRPHLIPLFTGDAVFEDDERAKLRVTQRLRKAAGGRRYAQNVILVFEPQVLEEAFAAQEAGDGDRVARLGARVATIAKQRLVEYKPEASEHEAFRIEIDERALDE